MQESILRFFQSISNPNLDAFFTYVTMLGEQYFIILIVAWIYWNYSKKEGFILSFLFIISGWVNSLSKILAHTQRPFQKLENFEGKRVHTATGHSFPSGHTQSASTLFLTLAMIFKQRTYMYLAILVSLLVAISRVYLGVHWPIDVIGGFLIALVLVLIFYNYLNRIYDNQKKLFRVILIALAVFYAIFLTIVGLNKFYLQEKIDLVHLTSLIGISTGSILFFILEEKKHPFSVDAQRWKKYLRFIIGIATTVGILLGLKHILPKHELSTIFRYFLVGAWVSGIFPMIGQKISLFKSEIN